MTFYKAITLDSRYRAVYFFTLYPTAEQSLAARAAPLGHSDPGGAFSFTRFLSGKPGGGIPSGVRHTRTGRPPPRLGVRTAVPGATPSKH